MKRMILGLLTVASPLLLAACDPNSVTDAAHSPAAPGLAGQAVAPVNAALVSGQSLPDVALQALENGALPGAILNTDVGCFMLAGFFNRDGSLAAFGLLFGEAGTFGTCGPGSFDRNNPDGSIDQFREARGSFFLSVVNPPVTFPSSGSDVKWSRITLAGGDTVFTIDGTLSDGSRVRAHFLSGAAGSSPASSLWIDGLGYVVGGLN